MNSSALPLLLGRYLPEYEQKQALVSTRSDATVPISEHLEQVRNGSDGAGKKSKHMRTMAHKRHAEAEEKASKEKEEKALHKLKMWYIVKENERRRKHRMLKDRVNLQHQMIKKQDELIQEKQEQQKAEKQNYLARARGKEVERLPQKEQLKSKDRFKPPNDDKHKMHKMAVPTVQYEEAPEKALDEQKSSDNSQKPECFSENDLTEFVEKSIMEDADFHELRYQPLQVQLERLFGEEADGYLNPTVKESPRKAFDLSIARRKGQHGAAALWQALRAYSRQKLVNKDAMILPDVKNAYACFVRECLRRHITPVQRNFVSEEEKPVNVNVEESDILKDVKYRRHRQELMYQIAHINKDKTKLLLQVTEQPRYTEAKDDDGIRRYYPEITHDEHEEKPALVKLPDIRLDNALTRRNSGNAKTKSKHGTISPTTQYRESDSKLIFLTERKATCTGQFSKRLNKEEKNGSKIEHSKSVGHLHNSKAHNTGFSQRIWEPLSMQALLDHHVSVLERRNEMVAINSSQVFNLCT